jgi:hypothetical protein
MEGIAGVPPIPILFHTLPELSRFSWAGAGLLDQLLITPPQTLPKATEDHGETFRLAHGLGLGKKSLAAGR